MKRLTISMLLFCLSMLTWATNEPFMVGNLYYQYVDEDTKTEVMVAKVPTGGTAYTGAIEIPSAIDVEGLGSRPVTKIAYGAFYNSTITGIVIPASVKTIDSGAFLNCKQLVKATFASLADFCAIRFADKDANPLTLTKHLFVSGQSTEITNLVIPEGVSTISAYAFYNCASLKSVTVPSSVTSIGSYAFYGCDSKVLTKATFASIPALCGISFDNKEANPIFYAHHLYVGNNEVTDVTTIPNIQTIGIATFAGASFLVTVKIPASVTKIKSDAFYGCTGLNAADYASIEKVTSIEYGNAEANPLSYAQYLKINGVVTQTIHFTQNVNAHSFANSKWLKEVTIAENVTSIGDGAFKGCSALTSVSFPSTLKTIGESAFNGCLNLSAVNLPAGLQQIGKQAFRDCRSLTVVNIPATVSLGIEVFMYCSGMTEVTWPTALKTIPERTFSGCSSLRTINQFGDVTIIDYGAFTSCTSLKELPVSNSLTTIRDNAFEKCTSLTNLVLPVKVTWIGTKAFSGCSSLTDVTLPASVNNILSEAFSECSSLKHVYSLKETPPESTAEDAFGGKENMMTLYVAIPGNYNGVTPWKNFTIATSGTYTLTFYVNENETPYHTITQASGTTVNVNSIPEPESTETEIFSGWNQEIPGTMPGQNMEFYGYISKKKAINDLTYLLMPKETKTGQNLAARATVIAKLDKSKYTMANVTIPATVTDDGVSYSVISINDTAFVGSTALMTVSFATGSSVKMIGKGAFRGCTSLMSIAVPSGVTTISEELFYGCTALSSITLQNGITEIGKQAFRNCASLTSVKIPGSVTTMGVEIFKDCNKLGTVEFASGIDILSLPDYTFQNCRALKNVKLQAGLHNIGAFAFNNCLSLVNIDIPEGITAIGNSAFYGCSSLEAVTLPTTVSVLGDATFGNCSNLTQITANRTEAPTAIKTTFDDNTYTKANLYIPETSTKYDNTEPWSLFEKRGVKKEYKLIYKVDGADYKNYQVMVGTTIAAEAAPVKEGHEFSGWEGLPNVMPAEDVTVTGRFKYQLKYVLAEGSVVFELPEAEWHFYGEDLTLSSELEHAGHIYEYTGMPADLKMPANDVTVTVKYLVSEQTTTVGNLNFKVFIQKGRAEVMPSPNASGTVEIPAQVTYGGKNYPVKAIQEKAFMQSGKTITKMNLPEGLDSIGQQAFRDCKFITITIPKTMKTIDKEAFMYCMKLENVYFDDKCPLITELSSGLFQSCASIVGIELPKNVQVVGEGAFLACDKLKAITLPTTVTTLRDRAFWGCKALETVTVQTNTMPAAETSTFDDVTYAVATLIVPEGINVATLPQPWVSFANKQSGTETYTNQCAKPTISYDKGKLKYATTTEGATIISEVVVADAKQSNVAEVTLTKEYVITVYAKKAGLADSEKVTATIKWCNGRPTMSGFTNVKLEENPLRGDVNEDGVVSITDAVSVVNLILGTNTSGAPAMEPEVAEPEDAVEPE